METVLTIAGAVLLVMLVVRLGIGCVDWLDWHTSQITDAEACRRARLTMTGHWPPVERFITGREFTRALMGLSVLWTLARYLHR